jgi:SAM-dependent methyltransferase
MSPDPVNLYDNVYADFASTAERSVRQEAYGEDLGQSSWLTAREWLEFADRLAIGPCADVLEVGSGSGGPAVYLAAARECRVTGVDINEHGVRNARAPAQAHGLSERVRFEVVDASGPLPFLGGSFHAVVPALRPHALSGETPVAACVSRGNAGATLMRFGSVARHQAVIPSEREGSA